MPGAAHRVASRGRALVALATASPLAVCATTLLTLLVGFASKARCLAPWQPGHQPKSCYNDVQYLWYVRRLVEHAPPWSGDAVPLREAGRVVGVVLAPGQLEYPVVTSAFAWVTALPVGGASSFLVVTALALAPFALVTGLALHRLVGRRALIFAASPQLAVYAFLNWDLLPVAATVAALWAWTRDRPALAAALLTVGAWAKIWPGFLLLPLLAHLVLEHRRRDAVRLVGTAAVVSAALNVPFALADADAWLAPFRMQSLRANDGTTNSIWWLMLDGPDVALANLGAGLAVLAAWVAVLAYALRVRRRSGTFPWLQAAAALVTSYVLLGRVDSPQYGLWLLPFLAVLAVPTWLVAVFVVSDLGLWLTWSWLWGIHTTVHEPAVWVRVVVLAVLVVALLRAPSRVPEPRPPVRPEPAAA